MWKLLGLEKVYILYLLTPPKDMGAHPKRAYIPHYTLVRILGETGWIATDTHGRPRELLREKNGGSGTKTWRPFKEGGRRGTPERPEEKGSKAGRK